jgi:hypothetical protein
LKIGSLSFSKNEEKIGLSNEKYENLRYHLKDLNKSNIIFGTGTEFCIKMIFVDKVDERMRTSSEFYSVKFKKELNKTKKKNDQILTRGLMNHSNIEFGKDKKSFLSQYAENHQWIQPVENQ